jgi:hypothetical protein
MRDPSVTRLRRAGPVMYNRKQKRDPGLACAGMFSLMLWGGYPTREQTTSNVLTAIPPVDRISVKADPKHTVALT